MFFATFAYAWDLLRGAERPIFLVIVIRIILGAPTVPRCVTKRPDDGCMASGGAALLSSGTGVVASGAAHVPKVVLDSAIINPPLRDCLIGKLSDVKPAHGSET